MASSTSEVRGCAVDLDAFFHDLGQALLIRLEIDLILEHIVDGVPLDKTRDPAGSAG